MTKPNPRLERARGQGNVATEEVATTSRPAWVAGAQVTGRPRCSAGSPSWWSSLAVGMAVGQKNIDQNDANVGQSHKRRPHPPRRRLPGRPADRDRRSSRARSSPRRTRPSGRRSPTPSPRCKPFSTIKNLRSPLDPANADQISADGHTVMVEFDLKGDDTLAKKNVDAIVAATDKVAAAHPDFYVGEAGSISSGKALDKMFNEQLAQGRRAVGPAHADRAADRLRRRRRRGRAAAARALGRHGHDRPRRAPEPHRPDGLRTSAPCSCSSASPSASTTRSST